MNDPVGDILFRMCKNVDTPKSLGVWLRYAYAQDELARLTIDPRAYNDAEVFFKDYACVNFLRKFEGLNTGIDTRATSLLTFDKAEEQCKSINRKFLTYSTTGQIDQVEYSILERTQKLIESVWGNPSFRDAFQHCGWGPGSTATLLGARATTEDKMSELPLSVTPSALPYLRQVMKTDLLWCGHLLRCPVDASVCLMPSFYNLISYSRLLTVPKDAKTDRVIAAEPTGNIFLQKGIGGYLRRRLRRFGINLDYQSRNQELAALAISGLATLDLSAASDTISIGLCKVLLPPDMFKILDDLRTPSFKLGQTITRFHKFSSMGNGFTFELETLIFWAAAKAVCQVRNIRGPIGVYGDDIIVPQPAVQEVISTLESFGFKINREKSFVDGRFFESCGKHYFDGVDVTPIYQKHIVDNDLEISRCYNRIYDLAFCRPFLGSEKTFGKIHSRCISKLSPRLKKFYAPGWVQGDGFFRVRNFTGRFSPNRGYQIHFMMATKTKKKSADGGLYAYVMRKHGAPRIDPFLSLGNESPSSRDFNELKSLEKVATLGYVDIRPKSRITTYIHSKRWVPLFGNR